MSRFEIGWCVNCGHLHAHRESHACDRFERATEDEAEAIRATYQLKKTNGRRFSSKAKRRKLAEVLKRIQNAREAKP